MKRQRAYLWYSNVPNALFPGSRVIMLRWMCVFFSLFRFLVNGKSSGVVNLNFETISYSISQQEYLECIYLFKLALLSIEVYCIKFFWIKQGLQLKSCYVRINHSLIKACKHIIKPSKIIFSCHGSDICTKNIDLSLIKLTFDRAFMQSVLRYS